MPNEEKKSIELGPIGSFIPQFFYDVIARLIPGAVIIGVLWVSALGPKCFLSRLGGWISSSQSNPPVILIILGVSAVSYAFSIIFLGIWSLGEWLLLLIVVVVRWLTSDLATALSSKLYVCQTFGEALKCETSKRGQSDENFSMQYDCIKHNDPEAGNRITKLKAEIHMAQVFILGFALSFAINAKILLFSSDPADQESRWYLAASLLLACLSSIGARFHFQKVQRSALKNYYKLLDCEKRIGAEGAAAANAEVGGGGQTAASSPPCTTTKVEPGGS